MSTELYERLQLGPWASREEIRAAYFRLAKELHPDRQAGKDADATERFLEIQQAYEILMDPNLRLEYERSHRSGPATPEGPISRPQRPVMVARPSSGR